MVAKTDFTSKIYNLMNQFFEFEKAVFRFTLARGLFLDNYFGEQSYHSQQG
jgi:hypothetical protein